jgi:hypothetical protein
MISVERLELKMMKAAAIPRKAREREKARGNEQTNWRANENERRRVYKFAQTAGRAHDNCTSAVWYFIGTAAQRRE